MPSPYSLFACLPKHMNTRPTSLVSCESFFPGRGRNIITYSRTQRRPRNDCPNLRPDGRSRSTHRVSRVYLCVRTRTGYPIRTHESDLTVIRLQLLEPDRYPYLFKCLYGLLMLLPHRFESMERLRKTGCESQTSLRIEGIDHTRDTSFLSRDLFRLRT
jgi:hypothetical protein